MSQKLLSLVLSIFNNTNIIYHDRRHRRRTRRRLRPHSRSSKKPSLNRVKEGIIGCSRRYNQKTQN